MDAGAVRQPAWVDVDGDGDLDLFVGFRDRADMLFRNTGRTVHRRRRRDRPRRHRARPSAPSGSTTTRTAISISTPRTWTATRTALYRNDKGRFTDVAEAAGLAWGGRAPRDATNGTVRPCAADVNGDGRFDLFTANYGPNGLFLNRGGGKFEDVSAAWGIAIDARYDTCAFADFDNDGRLDLYVNGTVTGGKSYRDYLFRNTGTRFEDVTPDNIRALEADHGALWADVDGDGDEDLALTGAQPNGMHLLLRNLHPRPAPAARCTSASSTAAAARPGPARRSASTPPGRGACSPPAGRLRLRLRRAERYARARRPWRRAPCRRRSHLPGRRPARDDAHARHRRPRFTPPRRESAVGSMKGLVLAVTMLLLVAGGPAAAQSAAPAAPDRARILSAAREVMKKARYASLVTLAAGGQPQARIIDPADPESDLTVWIATNPATRKVGELRELPRHALLLRSRHRVLCHAPRLRHARHRARGEGASLASEVGAALSRGAARREFNPDPVHAPQPRDRQCSAQAPGRPKTWRPVVLELK